MTGAKKGCEGLLGGLRKAGRRTFVGIAGARSEHIPPSRRHADVASTKLASNNQCRARRRAFINRRTIGAYRLRNRRRIRSRWHCRTSIYSGCRRLSSLLRNRGYACRSALLVDDTLRLRGVEDRVHLTVVSPTGQQTCQYHGGRSPSDDGHSHHYR